MLYSDSYTRPSNFSSKFSTYFSDLTNYKALRTNERTRDHLSSVSIFVVLFVFGCCLLRPSNFGCFLSFPPFPSSEFTRINKEEEDVHIPNEMVLKKLLIYANIIFPETTLLESAAGGSPFVGLPSRGGSHLD